MKRKYNKKNKKKVLEKKSLDLSLDNYFRNSNNKYKTTSYKRSPSPFLNISNDNKDNSLFIIRNPSKTQLLEESKQELKKYHNRAEKTILCDNKIIDTLYDKLSSSFEKLSRYLVNIQKFKYNSNIKIKELITKFILQLKYTDIAFISQTFLNETFNEYNISQNIKNFIGYSNFKGITMNFMPNNLKSCEIFWPNLTEIITKYLNNFHEGKGLFIYFEHDYLSYLNKIKLLCNLFNYETSVIDESNLNKCMILDKLSEAMQTKRLPSISESLGAQILMLEEMVNSFSYKWEIFIKNLEHNKNIINTNIIINKPITSNNNNKTYDISSFSNNISSISLNSSSSDLTSNDKIKFTDKDISIIYEELELKRKDSSSSDNKTHNKTDDNNFINDDIKSKLDSSTNETLCINNNKEKKINNKINDIKSIEQNKLLLSKKDKNKSTDKSKDKSSNKNRNKSSELKKRKNKKIEDDLNNTDIKGYFRENTKEHKIFTQVQNNIFLYCTKAKTAIIIVDSFSDKDIDKRYFNNILLKVSQTRCPIIVLSNNLDYLYNSPQKKVKNLEIHCILKNKNKRDSNIIYLYNFIIYLNIKLCPLKFEKNIKTYEQLMEYFNNNINNDSVNSELCNLNLRYIYNLSEYLCYYGKFQIDVIDLRLTEIFSEVEREINEQNLNPNDFDNIVKYIYDLVFPDKIDIYNDNNEEEKNIEEIYSEYEMESFMDYCNGIKEKLIDKYYKEKLNLNDSYKNYFKSKDSMVNLEGLLLGKYFNYDENNKLINEDKKGKNIILNKSFSFNDSLNNKLINKIRKSDQLFISYSYKRFITLSSLYNYIYPMNRMFIIKRNLFKKFGNRLSNIFKRNITEEQTIFIDMHVFKKLFPRIETNYFFNKNNIYYSENHLLKKSINQKKIKVIFYEKL